MYLNSKVLVLCSIFILHTKPSWQQEDCEIQFDLSEEVNDDKYLAFMQELEKLTFSVKENCDDPDEIDKLVWDYRSVLFGKYSEDMDNCQCSETHADFADCIDIVWEMIKVEIQMKRAEFYGYCGKNYESLDLEKYTKIGYTLP